MPNLKDLTVGMPIPARNFTPTNVSLFLYNAAIWNPHRIHYDEAYATGVEHHPGIVIDGPLQGDWLTQVVLEWLAEDGTLLEFEYSNRLAAYLGATLTAGGTISAIDAVAQTVALAVAITNAEGVVITPGRVLVRIQDPQGLAPGTAS